MCITLALSPNTVLSKVAATLDPSSAIILPSFVDFFGEDILALVVKNAAITLEVI